MRFILLLFSLLVSNLTFGQSFTPQSEVARVDSILIEKLISYRNQKSLPMIMENQILTHSARHHSEYMSISTIVGHDEAMELPRFNNINNPRKRVAHYANYEIPDDNVFAEVCVGIPARKIKNAEEAADQIFNELLKNNNKFLLEHLDAAYLGLSTQSDQKSIYTTIMIGIGYNNIVAILEANATR